MKKLIIARLIVFIFVSMWMYCYMGSMLAMEVSGEPEIKDAKISVKDSYKIWKAIEKLPETKEIEESLVSKITSAKNDLRGFGEKYPYLKSNIEGLIATQEAGNWDKFFIYKAESGN